MRFQFCGDLDCPDWVLAGINLLSRMSSLKLRTLCTLVMRNLLGEELDMAKLQKTTTDAKLSEPEVRAAVSVLLFVLESAARHSVPVGPLGQELQQLGLPREHAASLGRVLEQHRDPLRRRLLRQTLRQPGFTALDWELVTTRDSAAADSWSSQLALTVQLEPSSCPLQLGPATDAAAPPLQLLFSPQTAAVCRRELLLARQRMEDVS